jgi:hypothetical protein
VKYWSIQFKSYNKEYPRKERVPLYKAVFRNHLRIHNITPANNQLYCQASTVNNMLVCKNWMTHCDKKQKLFKITYSALLWRLYFTCMKYICDTKWASKPIFIVVGLWEHLITSIFIKNGMYNQPHPHSSTCQSWEGSGLLPGSLQQMEMLNGSLHPVQGLSLCTPVKRDSHWFNSQGEWNKAKLNDSFIYNMICWLWLYNQKERLMGNVISHKLYFTFHSPKDSQFK